MASTGSYFRRYEGFLPKIDDIIGKLRAGSASTYGTAARKAGAAFGGSAGGYSSMIGDIWSRRAGKLGEVEADIGMKDREQKLKMLMMAIDQANKDRQFGIGSLLGIGKMIGGAAIGLPGVAMNWQDFLSGSGGKK